MNKKQCTFPPKKCVVRDYAIIIRTLYSTYMYVYASIYMYTKTVKRYSYLHLCYLYVSLYVFLTSRCMSDAVCVWLYVYVYACLLQERWVYVLCCVACMSPTFYIYTNEGV